MKRFILSLIFLIFLFFTMPVNADTVPYGRKSIKYYGIGVINMPKEYNIYSAPSFNSAIIKKVIHTDSRKSAIVRSTNMQKHSYIAYVPSNNVALLPVDMNNEDNWYSVYLDQKEGQMGWVYNENPSDFYTYKDLFYKYGKPYGLRFFNDLTKDEKVLYSAENINSKTIDTFTFPEYVNFTVIRGNWILVSINDHTGQAKVGWFNWRNEDGTLNMFPNFKEKRL